MNKNKQKTLHLVFSTVLILGIAILAASCAGRLNFKEGHEAMEKKEWDQAVEYFIKAVNREPKNIEYRLSLANALISASNQHLNKGNSFFQQKKLKMALREFEKSLEYNPENNEARTKKHLLLKKIQKRDLKLRQKTHIETIKTKAGRVELPVTEIQYKRVPFSLEFRGTDVQQIFKVMQRSSGVNFIYDQAFKTKKIALSLRDVYFMDALEKIMISIKCFYKILDSRTVIIIPDTPAKRKEYEDLVIKTFFLGNGDPEEIRKIIREITGLRSISVNKKLNSVIIRGTPEQVQLAGKIIQVQDKARGEIFIDIEIIEVNRNRVKEYGIELSSYQVTETYSPVVGSVGTDPASTAAGSPSTIRMNMISHTDASDYLLTLPSINYKLLKFDTQSQLMAKPKLRVVDQEEVKVALGDKVPIPTTNFVPYNTGGPAQQPITSYQMEEIGINIKITPRLHHDGLVTLKMEFGLTFITIPGDRGVPPTIGNRSVETIIKLRDNETSILAGLLRDAERRTMRGLPFISRIPILKDIFSGNKNEVDQTDIILTITPRIIRFPDIQEEDLGYIWAGTSLRPGLTDPVPVLEVKENGKGKKQKPKAKTAEKKKK